MTDGKKEVRIPQAVYDEIQRRITSKDLNFETVEGFIEFALTDLLDLKSGSMTSKDEDEVSKRLAAFGY